MPLWRTATFLAILLAGCAADHPSSMTDPTLLAMFPARLPPAPADRANRFADDPAAARFGQQLFFDARFSGRLLDGDNDGSPTTLGIKGQAGKVACAGCHVPRAGFLDDRSLGEQVSLAAGWGLRRTPSLLDIAQASLVHWDGAHDALYNQIFGPLESPFEMNSSRLFMAQQIAVHYAEAYTDIFGPLPALDDAARFPPLTADATGCQPITVDPGAAAPCNGSEHGIPGDDAELDGMASNDVEAVTRVVVNAGKAIAAYERLLTCGPSHVDAWVHGDKAALSDAEVRGLTLFTGKAGCTVCHSGPFLTDHQFHNVGLAPQLVAEVFTDSNDAGAAVGISAALANPLNRRGVFSDGDDGGLPNPPGPELLGAFRTPSLRCVAMRPSFMHTGHMRTLDEAVRFFNRGGDRAGFLGVSELAPLGLSGDEQSDLIAFLEALTGPGPDESLLTPLP
jgi:cytochrome c peroxidase